MPYLNIHEITDLHNHEIKNFHAGNHEMTDLHNHEMPWPHCCDHMSLVSLVQHSTGPKTHCKICEGFKNYDFLSFYVYF
jgi:hypothetical protein